MMASRTAAMVPRAITSMSAETAAPVGSTGTMTSIVATDFHCEPDYAAKAMVQTLVAMVITLPLWIMIVQI